MSTLDKTLAKVRLEDGTVVYNHKGLSSIKPLSYVAVALVI